MNLASFNKAKTLREQIQHFQTKQIQVKHFQEREGDEEFNILRQLAYDGLEYAIKDLEKEFETL